MMGGFIKGQDSQYVAMRDGVTGTWRIVDLWSDSIRGFDPEDDIPDENPAVTLLTEAGFLAIIKTATKDGILENVGQGGMVVETDTSEMEEKIDQLKIELDNAQNKVVILTSKLENVPTQILSENHLLKERAMDNLVKLAAMGSIENVEK